MPRVNAFVLRVSVFTVLVTAGAIGLWLRASRRADQNIFDGDPRQSPGASFPRWRIWPVEGPADQPEGTKAAVLAIRKRSLLSLEHERALIEHADEQAFDALRLPEELRGAVRRLNADSGQERRALLGVEVDRQAPDDERAAAEVANAELDRIREQALENLLGVDAFQLFEAAEAAALRRLRERFPGWADRVGGGATASLDLAKPSP
jgi:hypothetical protein